MRTAVRSAKNAPCDPGNGLGPVRGVNGANRPGRLSGGGGKMEKMGVTTAKMVVITAKLKVIP